MDLGKSRWQRSRFCLRDDASILEFTGAGLDDGGQITGCGISGEKKGSRWPRREHVGITNMRQRSVRNSGAGAEVDQRFQKLQGSHPRTVTLSEKWGRQQ